MPGTVHDYYSLESFSQGVYSMQLTGLFATCLAINFLQGKGELFLLGMDWTRRTLKEARENKIVKTHYYSDIRHNGFGYTGFYENHNPDTKWFKPFLREKNIKIYNVSLISNINIFPKLTSQIFFSKIKKRPDISQDAWRDYVRNLIKIKSHLHS